MNWDIAYFVDQQGNVPAESFLENCPMSVEAHLIAVLDAVAEAPPPQFSGGGKWEAMHGDMKGYYEVRATGPGREQFRLFCLLENADAKELQRRGLEGPAIVVLTGMRKPHRQIFDQRDYAGVHRLGGEHKRNVPRRVT